MTQLRAPYVGEGADGARRSAQIDLEEADCMDPGEDRDRVLLSAERWQLQAEQLEHPSAVPTSGGSEPKSVGVQWQEAQAATREPGLGASPDSTCPEGGSRSPAPPR